MANLATDLTTTAKVKAKLGITDTSYDSIIDDIVRDVSALICNLTNRQFLQVQYDEQYDTDGGEYLFLRQAPLATSPAPVVYFRGGAIDNPVWTTFLASGYYVYSNAGYLRFAGRMPKNGRQIIRVAYTAGYLINFASEGTSAHTLPYDVTKLASDLCVRNFNHRAALGFASEQIEGYKQEYTFTYTDEQQALINKYSKPRVAI